MQAQMHETAAPVISSHPHDYSISIAAAEVPQYLLPELEAMLLDKLNAIVRDNNIWGDLRVTIDYDGRQGCPQAHSA